MKSKEMKFYYGSQKDDGFGNVYFSHASFVSKQEISEEDYEIYDKVFKTYMDFVIQYTFDITRVVHDIRCLFKGIEETKLTVGLEDEDKKQRVYYEDGSVSCYLENSKLNDKIIAKDDEKGFEVSYIKSKENLSSENEEDLINSITDIKDKIIKLKLMGQNKKPDTPTIFGYTLDQIKEENLKFEFEVSFVGLQITAKPTKVKKLIYEGIDGERLKELDEITDCGRRGTV